jgi:hypothetical protein
LVLRAGLSCPASLVLEMIMLVFFGAAWLVKGTTLLHGEGGTADATLTA